MPTGKAWSDLLRLKLTCSVVLSLAQSCSDLLKLAQTCSNLLTLAQTCSDLLKLAQTCSDLLSFAQTCSDLLKLAQTCSNLLKLVVRTGTILEIFETKSDTYKVTTLGLLYPRWFHKFMRIGEKTEYLGKTAAFISLCLALAQWFFTTPLHSLLAEHKTKSSQLPKLYHDLGCWKLCAKVHEKLGGT